MAEAEKQGGEWVASVARQALQALRALPVLLRQPNGLQSIGAAWKEQGGERL